MVWHRKDTEMILLHYFIQFDTNRDRITQIVEERQLRVTESHRNDNHLI